MAEQKIKCPWCGRLVSFKAGRLEPHVQSGRVKCVGVGMVQHQVEWLRERIDERKGKRNA